MTALTPLQSRPATAQPFTTAGNVRQCYERLLQAGGLDAETQALLQEILETERHHVTNLGGKWTTA